MKKRTLIILVLIMNMFLLQLANSAVRLPALVSSNMVLQRNTTVQLWGWADTKEKFTIEFSWKEEIINVEADKDGNWRVAVETTNSKEPQTIRIKGKKTSHILLDNILFGEVWLCSGQSNMQQPLKGYNGQPTFGFMEAVMKPKNSNLRLFSVDRLGSRTPLEDIQKYKPWQEASPDNIASFSAVGYFFGQQLQEVLDVPVGMIHTSWGGSSVQAWMSQETISSYQEVNLDEVDISVKSNQTPTALFNAMCYPLIPYTIKGALWYQGESNRKEPAKYRTLFPAMVEDWRSRWGIGDFPFYFAQIAPYTYGDNEAFQTVDNSAFIREVQLQCVDLIPNSGIAITMDLGDPDFIHPPKKKEVADRLLYNALNQTYGFNTVKGASPVFDSLILEENGVLLKFKNAESGLYSFSDLEGFEIAGKDKVFYPAEAKIVKRKNVLVSSDQVANPIAVRYAWRNWVLGTLYNTNLIPASSFRTDDWDDATRAKP
ncbi:MAG: sialate O-acetylesterase [Cyclobacteriaceae bacterium]